MVIYSLFYDTLHCTYVLFDWVVGFYSGSVCNVFFLGGEFPHGAFFFILTIALFVGVGIAVEGFNFFVVAFYDLRCYLHNCSWPSYCFCWKILLGGYDWRSVCILDFGNLYWYLMLCICCKVGWTKLYFCFCVLVCFLEVCILMFITAIFSVLSYVFL